MAKRSRSDSLVPEFLRRWCSQRGLLLIEAILLAKAGEQYGSGLVMATRMPDASKVLFSMTLALGLFGALVLLAQQLAYRGVRHTHVLVQRLPLPMVGLLLHAAILFGLFSLWSGLLGCPWWR